MMYRLELASDVFPLFNYSPETVFFFFFSPRLQLIARSERTQQKFIYSLFCDFQAAEQGLWPQEHGYWRLLKHMWSLFLLICPVSGLATKSKVHDASVWEEKWVVFKNPAEAPPKRQLTGTKMESGQEMLAHVWRPVQLWAGCSRCSAADRERGKKTRDSLLSTKFPMFYFSLSIFQMHFFTSS